MRSLWRWFTDAALADAIAGDLEEQRRHRAQRSRVAAEVWFWHRSLAVAWFFGRASMQGWLGRLIRGVIAGPGGLGADIRYSARALRRSSWYALTVIAVVVLGMTLATTVFAVVDGVLFRPLPYPAANRLVAIEPGFAKLPAPASPANTSSARRINGASLLDVVNWRAAAPDTAITGFRAQPWGGLGEGVNGAPYGGALVEANFFDTIGVQPLVGGFTAADFDHEDTLRPVIISFELWQSRFHGKADVIGERFISDSTRGSGIRVVGVMPSGFVFPSSFVPVRVIGPFVPNRARAFDPSIRNFTEVVARLPDHADAQTLGGRLETGSLVTAAAFPVRGPKPAGWTERGWAMQGAYDSVKVTALSSRLGRDERPLFAAVFAAAIILLVLGGLNVSGLMTARGLDRARELTLRRALGASAPAIARLVVVEALLPIALGSLVGLALAVPLLRVGARLLPEELVLLRAQPAVTIDLRVALFVLISALLLAMLTTIWPIRRALAPAAALAEGARATTGSRSFGRTVIVVSQVAGALVLTLGGGLLVTSILAVYSHRPPIRTDGVVVIGITMVGPGGMMGAVSPERNARMQTLIETIRRVPGVESAGLTDAQILVGGSGYPLLNTPASAPPRMNVDMQGVTADFYRVLRPQVVMGRLPNDRELADDAAVIVVSEALARGYWPNQSPIGQTLDRIGDKKPFTVVGVVKDVRWTGWDDEIASIYGPYAQLSRFPFPTVFIRTQMSVSQTLALVTPAVAAVDPLMSMDRANTLPELFKDSVRQRRLQSWLFGSFAFAALVIVGSGILGLIAMSTARRTREMGIRLALGSTREGLVRLLLREQLRGVAAGVLVGSAVSVWAVRFVQAYLYEVTAYDRRVWLAAILVVVATAVIGTLVPSLQAGRTDPVEALRVE